MTYTGWGEEPRAGILVHSAAPDADGTSCSVVAWDPTHNRRTHDGYLTVAVGRDYLDVAPMSGTYDASRRTNGRLIVDKRVEVA